MSDRSLHLTVGELLIDLVAADAEQDLGRATVFHAAAGGAPANVAVGLARLGCRSALITRVATDAFGRRLRSILEAEGVETAGLVSDAAARTPLAFVGVTEQGDRSFIFYLRGLADTTLRVDELNLALLTSAGVIHFGSVTLSSEAGRAGTLYAVEQAKEAGALVSFDPNLRPELWGDARQARSEVERALGLVDIVKVSADELEPLTGRSDPEEAATVLLTRGPSLVVVTLGPNGAYYRTTSGGGWSPGFAVPVIDTTGAGDGFMAGLLTALRREADPLASICDATVLHRTVEFANAAGALTTTHYGAIPALPRLGAVKGLLAEQRRDSPAALA